MSRSRPNFPSLKGKIQVVSQTDTGRVRDHNEDAAAADMDTGLIVLADGMGGYNAGEVAAELAIKTISKLVRDGIEGKSQRRKKPLDLTEEHFAND